MFITQDICDEKSANSFKITYIQRMSILLTLRNLSLHFGEKIIFKNAELAIHKGDRIGLIGLNGQGKSTLFNILMDKLKPDTTTPPFLYDRSNDHFDIFLIPQELDIRNYAHLGIENFYLSFYPELYEVHQKLIEDYGNQELLDKFEHLGGWDIQNSYLNYLRGFDFDDLDKNLEDLSGGERRKIALSIGLSSTAELILWDEPTNHLDIETIERFEDELLNSKKTYMIISHDRYLLNTTTDKICHIERGQITSFKGTYLDYLVYLEEREAELKKNLDKLENKHRRELAWMRQGTKARRTRSKKRVEGYHDIKDGIKDLKSRSRKVVDLGLLHSGRKSKILVQIEDGQFSYPGKDIFKNLNLMVAKKDKIALIGPNGAGKSTLIKIFSEKLKLTNGVQKNAEDLKVIVFDQNRDSLDPESTPIEVVGEGQDFVHLGDGTKKHVASYLSKFLFTSDQVYRPISTLSGGEKNRLQLAMFMKQAADLWVFDEPTNDLDIETIEILERELKSYDSAVIIIGHDRAFLDNTCNSTWLVHDKGVEVFEGGYTQVAPYLHALEIEKDLKGKGKGPSSKEQEQTSKESQPEVPLKEADLSHNTKPDKELTNKQKERLKVIEREIEEAEKSLIEVEEILAKFDYTSMDDEKADLIQRLTAEKDKRESTVSELYEEWEELNS